MSLKEIAAQGCLEAWREEQDYLDQGADETLRLRYARWADWWASQDFHLRKWADLAKP